MTVRSKLVFDALERVPNPFLLCHIVRLRARMAMQRPQTGAISAINRELADCKMTDMFKAGPKMDVAPALPLIFNAAVGE